MIRKIKDMVQHLYIYPIIQILILWTLLIFAFGVTIGARFFLHQEMVIVGPPVVTLDPPSMVSMVARNVEVSKIDSPNFLGVATEVTMYPTFCPGSFRSGTTNVFRNNFIMGGGGDTKNTPEHKESGYANAVNAVEAK